MILTPDNRGEYGPCRVYDGDGAEIALCTLIDTETIDDDRRRHVRSRPSPPRTPPPPRRLGRTATARVRPDRTQRPNIAHGW